ncbi:MAG: hypothetical protein ACYCOU_04075 [Sulfobacillus sp.]
MAAYQYILLCLTCVPQALVSVVVGSLRSVSVAVPCFSYDGLNLDEWLLTSGAVSLGYAAGATFFFFGSDRPLGRARARTPVAVCGWTFWFFKVAWAIYGMVKMFGACLSSVTASDTLPLTVFSAAATGDLLIGIGHPAVCYLLRFCEPWRTVSEGGTASA